MTKKGDLVHISISSYKGFRAGEIPADGQEADGSANMHVWVAPEAGESFVLAITELINTFLTENNAINVPSPEALRQ